MLRGILPGLIAAAMSAGVAAAGSSPALDQRGYEELVASLRLAAEHGHADAQYGLGDMYYHGEGIEQSPIEAARWYRMAAEQGHAEAQFELGDMHHYGDGIERNRAEAARWYRMAAEQGHSGAQFQLGRIYSMGWDVPEDRVLGHKWLSLAAEQGYPGAGVERDSIAASMTADQIAQARRLASEWRRK